MPLDGAGDRDDGRSQRATGRHDFEPDSRTELGILRVETKLDSFMQIQKMRDDAILQEIKYIRDTHISTSSDHEARIRALEGKRYIEPRTLWTAFSLLTALSGVIVAIVNLATR
jgi:hypothetical protein